MKKWIILLTILVYCAVISPTAYASETVEYKSLPYGNTLKIVKKATVRSAPSRKGVMMALSPSASKTTEIVNISQSFYLLKTWDWSHAMTVNLEGYCQYNGTNVTPYLYRANYLKGFFGSIENWQTGTRTQYKDKASIYASGLVNLRIRIPFFDFEIYSQPFDLEIECDKDGRISPK